MSKVQRCDSIGEATRFARGKRPLRYFSGFELRDYQEITRAEAVKLARANPTAMIIGSRPIGCRPGEVVIQPQG